MAQDLEQAAQIADETTPIEMRAQQVVALINGEIEPEEVFTDSFLAAVPPEQFASISQQLTSQYGAAIAVEALGDPSGNRSALSIRMERAIARGGLAIDAGADNRISELLFQTFDPVDDSMNRIRADLDALPGEVSWAFIPLGAESPICAKDAERQMPIGSTFKLYVLAALGQEIADGRWNWDDVVTLENARSYPSGTMQDWPQDAPVTLQTLASMMISISDNTATDALVKVVGKDAILSAMRASGHDQPELNVPFLTTREMFLLKAGSAERLARYRQGSAAEKAQILTLLAEENPSLSEVGAAFVNGPNALDVEWFASAQDLANLFRFMRRTGDRALFEIMAINPSVPEPARSKWDYAGYKGGSEPGVLNLTWLLMDSDGADHVLTLSWRNDDKDLDNPALEQIASRLLFLDKDQRLCGD